VSTALSITTRGPSLEVTANLKDGTEVDSTIAATEPEDLDHLKKPKIISVHPSPDGSRLAAILIYEGGHHDTEGPVWVLAVLGAGADADGFPKATRVRADIAEIRRGRLPTSVDVLGWTADGTAVVRTGTCERESSSSGEQVTCRFQLLVGNGTDLRAIHLGSFSVPVEEGRTRVEVPYEYSRRLIRTEQLALSLLAELTPGTSHTEPWTVGKRSKEAALSLALATGSGRSNTGPLLEVVAERDGDKVAVANVADLSYQPGKENNVISDYSILREELSPDGDRAVLVVEWTGKYGSYPAKTTTEPVIVRTPGE
jgi:hypothetical protein